MTHRVETIEENLWETRAASTAGGGTVLSTTPTLISIPLNSRWIGILPRDFIGADVAQYFLNPYLTIVRTQDLLVSPAQPYGATRNYSDEFQDGDTTDVTIGEGATQFDTLANGHALYVGSRVPFRGTKVTIGTTANDVSPSVLTIKYWSVTGAWVDTGNSEGTKSGDVCLAVDGDETWAVPANWRKESLNKIGDAALRQGFAVTPLYWTRWETSAALKASAQLKAIQPLNRSTAYTELAEGMPYQQALQNREFACVEALCNAGDAKLLVDVGVTVGEEFE